MNFRGLIFSSLALAVMLYPVPASAATTAIKRIGADEARSLCPSIGSTGLVLGEPLSRQNSELAEQPKKLSPRYVPFTEVDLEFTSWSGRLAAITYRAPSPDGDANLRWGMQLEESLRQAGWVSSMHSDLISPIVVDPKAFEKQFETPDGPRAILLEFDVSGALMLRCGDVGLLEISRNERDGRLEPGSPRPIALAVEPAAPLPTKADCSNPEVLQAFKVPGRVDETVPALRRLTQGPFLIAEQKRESERLHTWLSWKLRTSGHMSEDQVWQVEQAAAPSVGAESDMTRLVNLLGTLKRGFSDKRSREASCRSFVEFMIGIAETDKHEIARWAKINEALETEAPKHAIDTK